jgi:UDP-glucose 4-epimerase
MESDHRAVLMNAGSGRGTSINELAETVRTVCPRESSIEHTAPRTADNKHSVAKVERAREMLGFSTHISLVEGLKAFF